VLVHYLKNAGSCILDGTQEFHGKKFLVLEASSEAMAQERSSWC